MSFPFPALAQMRKAQTLKIGRTPARIDKTVSFGLVQRASASCPSSLRRSLLSGLLSSSPVAEERGGYASKLRLTQAASRALCVTFGNKCILRFRRKDVVRLSEVLFPPVMSTLYGVLKSRPSVVRLNGLL